MFLKHLITVEALLIVALQQLLTMPVDELTLPELNLSLTELNEDSPLDVSPSVDLITRVILVIE